MIVPNLHKYSEKGGRVYHYDIDAEFLPIYNSTYIKIHQKSKDLEAFYLLDNFAFYFILNFLLTIFMAFVKKSVKCSDVF